MGLVALCKHCDRRLAECDMYPCDAVASRRMLEQVPKDDFHASAKDASDRVKAMPDSIKRAVRGRHG